MSEYIGLWIAGVVALAILAEWAAIATLLPH